MRKNRLIFLKDINKIRRTKGSITVEAAIIIPLVFSVVAFTMYMVFFLYQYAYLQASANYIAESSASQWKYLSKGTTLEDIIEAKPQVYNKPDLYWRLYDFSQGWKTSILDQYHHWKTNNHRLINSSPSTNSSSTAVSYLNGFFSNKIVVSNEEIYKIPVDNVTRVLGIRNLFKINIKAQSTIIDPAERIRTVDFAVDILQKNDKAKELKDKYFEKIEDINESIKDFLNIN